MGPYGRNVTRCKSFHFHLFFWMQLNNVRTLIGPPWVVCTPKHCDPRNSEIHVIFWGQEHPNNHGVWGEGVKDTGKSAGSIAQSTPWHRQCFVLFLFVYLFVCFFQGAMAHRTTSKWIWYGLGGVRRPPLGYSVVHRKRIKSRNDMFCTVSFVDTCIRIWRPRGETLTALVVLTPCTQQTQWRPMGVMLKSREAFPSTSGSCIAGVQSAPALSVLSGMKLRVFGFVWVILVSIYCACMIICFMFMCCVFF